MKKNFLQNIITLVTGILLLSSSTQTGLAMSSDTKPLPSAIDGVNSFGFKLLSELSKTTDGNILISPFSISQALEMTCNGAAGETAKEMSTALGVGNLSIEELNKSNLRLNNHLNNIQTQDKQVTFDSANSLWVSDKLNLNKNLSAALQTNYEAEIGSVDFTDPATRIRINNWVKSKTHNKIAEILAPNTLSNATRLILVNGVYFKGMWSQPFDKKMTSAQKFTPLSGTAYSVPMMQKQAHYDYTEQAAAQMISLPYGTKKIAMYILLPPQTTGLKEFISSFSYDNYKTMRDKTSPRDISLMLPKYKLEYGVVKLKEQLQSLGMKQAFIDDQADFSKMVEDKDKDKLVISDVLHKATMEIDEQGTVASAATAVVMMAATAMMPLEIKIDRPFLTVIEDKSTGSILFLGLINKP